MKEQITVPNGLTLLRFFCIPVMAYYIMEGDDHRITAFVLYIAIWTTDLLDGYIARRYNQITDLGKLMDPFVDKVMQFTAAIVLYSIGKVPFWLPVFVALKELLMFVGTAVVLKSRHQVVYAKWYGKLATLIFVAGSGIVVLIPVDAAAKYSKYIFIPVVLISVLAAVNYSYGGLKMLSKIHSGESASSSDEDG